MIDLKELEKAITGLEDMTVEERRAGAVAALELAKASNAEEENLKAESETAKKEIENLKRQNAALYNRVTKDITEDIERQEKTAEEENADAINNLIGGYLKK